MTQQELLDSCYLTSLSKDKLDECFPFLCDDADLDEFFAKDALVYSEKLIGKTFIFRLRSNPKQIVTAFTIANDSIRLTNRLPEEYKDAFLQDTDLRDKDIRRFPGVLIGRLGTDIHYAGQGYGSAVMDFIKATFRAEKRSGCRFLIVDAKNNPDTIHYYQKNNFQFLIEDEKLEAKYVGIGLCHLPLNTRLMYYDLLQMQLDEDNIKA